MGQRRDEISRAIQLLSAYTPIDTHLTVEQTDGILSHRYIVRLVYTSRSSGRKMSLIAKGDHLPTEPGHELNYYLRQIVLSPQEVARRFSRIYFMEHRARQDSFLHGDNVRVQDITAERDKLGYEKYAL